MLPDITMQEMEENRKFLLQLAKEYPTVASAASQIVNLESLLKLPKGTEHFMSDLHGEYEAFTHILNNASGVIKEKVDTVLGQQVPAQERAEFATLIYYPAQKLQQLKPQIKNLQTWYHVTLLRLVDVCRLVASKHTRGFVRQNLPEGFAYIIDELLHAHFEDHNRDLYYDRIISSVVDVGRADAFIEALATLIKTLAVLKLHIVGDIFDRGPRPDIILDKLMAHHATDIQWGNHDVQWMGAGAGSDVCMAGVINVTLAYNNLEALEDGYGISLRPLSVFAEDVYRSTDVTAFLPKLAPGTADNVPMSELLRAARMHKAIAVMLFKLECAAIERNPDFDMADRAMLTRINYVRQEINLGGKWVMLQDCDFPTVNPHSPATLTDGECQVLAHLRQSFAQSEKLARHVRFLFTKGSIYHVENGNLLYHGAVPMQPDGTLAQVRFGESVYSGVQLMDYCEHTARQGFFAPEGSRARVRGQDFLWYLWCGKNSPVFGRDKMTTFEQLFVADKEYYAEIKNPYYTCIENKDEKTAENAARTILREFGLNPDTSHIINGHVPVRAVSGESPIKAGGRLIVIDGGFCKAYHSRTGTAGYTLVFSSRGLSLRSHEPFENVETAIRENKDILSTVNVFETVQSRMYIADTDEGKKYGEQIRDLQMLLAAYAAGIIKESE